MGYVNNDFGTLADVRLQGSLVIIENSDGETRKMSRDKYKESADEVYNKARHLVGKEVRIRTSQNTNNWNEREWFSDIYQK